MLRFSLPSPARTHSRACWRGLHQAPVQRSSWQQHHGRAAPAWRFSRVAASADSSSPDLPPVFPSPALEQQRQEWQARLLEVTAFQQQHGWVPRQRPRPGRPLVEGEAELGRWCTEQRRRRGNSWGEPLSAGEAAALRAIPGWNWGQQQGRGEYAKWEQRLPQVADFVAQHGRLPRQEAGRAQPLLEGEGALGNWCDVQRQRYKGHRAGEELTPEQVAALEALPGWVWELFRREPWELRLGHVAAFLMQHGRLPRQSGSKAEPLLEGEQQLGDWCSKQRQRYKGTGGRRPLTPEQVAALEALPGWLWEEFQLHLWEQRLQQLAAFVAQHSRLPRQKGSKAVPLAEGEGRLGRWVSWQRLRRKEQGKHGSLTAEQVAALEAFVWWRWS